MSTTFSTKFKIFSTLKPKSIQEANFLHLYWDIAWFGIAFGSTLSFLPVFATRVGAAGWQLGLLTAGPALIGILFTLPAGHWLESRPLGRAVTQTAFWHRAGFFLLIPLPLVIPMSFQVWAVLTLMLLMAIPGTALMVGFNALLAAAVPPEARSKVVGRRNALLAGTVMTTFLLSGWILDQLPFTWGYTIVFIMGAIGSALSTFHLARIRVPAIPQFQGRPLKDLAQPGQGVGFIAGMSFRWGVGLRLWLNHQFNLAKILEHISAPYWGVMVAFFLFHFTQWLPAAVFSMFWVREARLTDGEISWVNAAFYLTILVVSPLLEPLSKRAGNYRLTMGGAILMAFYPLLVAASYHLIWYILGSVYIGVVWAILSGSLVNRLLELIPEAHRAAHLAVYNMALNIAVLLSAMLGPFLAGIVGLREALVITFILRLVSGLALARWS
jgi:MFS family permease